MPDRQDILKQILAETIELLRENERRLRLAIDRLIAVRERMEPKEK